MFACIAFEISLRFNCLSCCTLHLWISKDTFLSKRLDDLSNYQQTMLYAFFRKHPLHIDFSQILHSHIDNKIIQSHNLQIRGTFHIFFRLLRSLVGSQRRIYFISRDIHS